MCSNMTGDVFKFNRPFVDAHVTTNLYTVRFKHNHQIEDGAYVLHLMANGLFRFSTKTFVIGISNIDPYDIATNVRYTVQNTHASSSDVSAAAHINITSSMTAPTQTLHLRIKAQNPQNNSHAICDYRPRNTVDETIATQRTLNVTSTTLTTSVTCFEHVNCHLQLSQSSPFDNFVDIYIYIFTMFNGRSAVGIH